jgi:hypothetical protein
LWAVGFEPSAGLSTEIVKFGHGGFPHIVWICPDLIKGAGRSKPFENIVFTCLRRKTAEAIKLLRNLLYKRGHNAVQDDACAGRKISNQAFWPSRQHWQPSRRSLRV